MKTYGFKERWAEMLESDAKISTIRAKGKRQPPVPGEIIRRYTSMRTKKCKHRGDRVCDRVYRLRFDKTAMLFINGKRADAVQCEAIASMDGFSSICDLRAFFFLTHGFPFDGHLIIWKPKSKTPKLHD